MNNCNLQDRLPPVCYEDTVIASPHHIHVFSNKPPCSLLALTTLLLLHIVHFYKHVILLSGHNARYARNTIFQNALNAISKCHLRHRASFASALEFYGHDPIVRHINQRHIATISLQRGTNKLQYCSYI